MFLTTRHGWLKSTWMVVELWAMQEMFKQNNHYRQQWNLPRTLSLPYPSSLSLSLSCSPLPLSPSLSLSPFLLRLEWDLYWFMYHVHDEAVLVASGGNLVQVLPHWCIRWKHWVIVKKKTIETRIILKRTVEIESCKYILITSSTKNTML